MERIKGMSLVTICKNQQKELDIFIDWLFKQNAIPEEWIFVDDGSEEEIVFKRIKPNEIIYTKNKTYRIPKVVRSLGVVAANNDIISFCSVDQIPYSKNFFEKHFEMHLRNKNAWIWSSLHDVNEGDIVNDLKLEVIFPDYRTVRPGFSSFRRSSYLKAISNDLFLEIDPKSKGAGEDTVIREIMREIEGVSFYIPKGIQAIHISHNKEYKHKQKDIIDLIRKIRKNPSLSDGEIYVPEVIEFSEP